MDSLVKIDLLGQSYTLRTDAKRVKAAAEVLRAKLNEYEGATRSNIKLDVALLAGLDLASETVCSFGMSRSLVLNWSSGSNN